MGCGNMDRWITTVVIDGKEYKIHMKRRYSPAVSEYLFDLEIICDDGSDMITNRNNIYSKKDAEAWIRQKLHYKGRRFFWSEIE